MILKFAETHYFFELERKDRVNRQATFSGAVAVVYFPLLGQLLAKYDLLSLAEWLTYILFIISMAFGITFLVKFFAFFGHNYYYVADSREILNKYRQAENFDRKVGEPPSARHDVVADLAEDYAECAALNKKTNDEKARLLLDANRAIFGGIVSGAFSYFFLIAFGGN